MLQKQDTNQPETTEVTESRGSPTPTPPEVTGRFELEVGWMCPPISEQIYKAGFHIPEKDSKRLDTISEAILTLHLNRIISGSMRDKANQKLMKEVSKAIHSQPPGSLSGAEPLDKTKRGE